MANHLTPTELARESGLERREVIVKCMELGVPIFQGRIDKTLFLASLDETGPARERRGQRRLTRVTQHARRHTLLLVPRQGGELMEAAAPPVTTGSKTMADLFGRAAQIHGDGSLRAPQGRRRVARRQLRAGVGDRRARSASA